MLMLIQWWFDDDDDDDDGDSMHVVDSSGGGKISQLRWSFFLHQYNAISSASKTYNARHYPPTGKLSIVEIQVWNEMFFVSTL